MTKTTRTISALGACLLTGAILLPGVALAAAGSEAAGSEAAADTPTSPPSAPPGNNGTVKIHDGANEPDPVTRNQPHVCTFHVDAMGFDADQALSLSILSWQPTGDRTEKLDGTLTVDADGKGRWPATGALELPDGHYRLVVDTGDGQPTRDKHKMFWVRCSGAETHAGGSNGGGSSSGDSNDRSADLGDTMAGSAANSAASEQATDSTTAVSADRLPSTGAGFTLLLASVGLALIAAGAVLRMRHRTK